jgi:hypothetical protein
VLGFLMAAATIHFHIPPGGIFYYPVIIYPQGVFVNVYPSV